MARIGGGGGVMRVTGTDRMLRNLNKEIRGIVGRTEAGLLQAGLLIKRRSQKEVPVDTGNLKAGAYVTSWNIPFKGPVVEIGYQAAYAAFVHEVQRSHRVGKWKFLEDPLKRSAKDVLAIIRKRAKII